MQAIESHRARGNQWRGVNRFIRDVRKWGAGVHFRYGRLSRLHAEFKTLELRPTARSYAFDDTRPVIERVFVSVYELNRQLGITRVP